MDELLDALTPLAHLLASGAARTAAVAALTDALFPGGVPDTVPASPSSASGAAAGPVAGLAAEQSAGSRRASETAGRLLLVEVFGRDSSLAAAALDRALPASQRPRWPLLLSQADVLARQLAREQEAGQPRLVVTLPAALRSGWAGHLAGQPADGWPRETLPVLLDLAASAERTLVLASPYLGQEQARPLAAQVRRLTRSGGQVLVLTRTGADGRGPAGNAPALAMLRDAAAAPGTLRVWAWRGRTLGLHCKAMVADGTRAYLGSANLTSLGALEHAEAGVLACGPLAAQLEGWLRLLADTPEEPAA